MPASHRLLLALAGSCLPGAALAADLGLPAAYLCGDRAVALAAGQDEARLRLGGRWLTFRPVPAASGAKYQADGRPDIWVWTKGPGLMVKLPETGETGCEAAASPASVPFSAGGVEPGWRLTIEAGEARLSLQQGGMRGAPVGPAEAIPGGRSIGFGADNAEITDAVCRDPATGMPFPHAVRVRTGGWEFRGCGGDPRDLLAGTTWHILSVAGAGLPEGVDAYLRFETEGFAGLGGCNRLRGAYDLTGEGLTLGPVAATRMACPEPQMQAEAALTAALASVTRFDFADDGGLVLFAGDSPAVRTRP